MSWDEPYIYVESTLSQPDLHISSTRHLLMKASEMYPSVDYWKPLLLGHAKYASYPHWDPIKPIRGEPEEVSKDLDIILSQESNAGGTRRDNLQTITWYTLEELMNVEFEERIGNTEPKKSYRGTTYEISHNGRSIDLPRIAKFIEDEVLEDSFRNDVTINLNENADIPFETRFRGEGIREVLRPVWKEKFKTSLPHEVTLGGVWRKKNSYGDYLEEFIHFLDEQRKKESFSRMKVGGKPERDEIRIVVWV